MSSRGELLVVDDDREMARTLADLLRLQEWTVSTAHSGEEAVAAFESHPFDVVLMDIKMKGMSGVDALKRIRAIRPAARVILMTAYTTSELVEEALAAGVVEVLPKPLAIPELLALVAREAERKRPVLVVDDDPDFLRALCDSLEEHGLSTQRAVSLHQAIALLEGRDEFQVVLLDLVLQELAGSESVLAIREACPEVLFVLFSGHPDLLEETVADLPEGWILASLAKPFDPGRLLRILEQLDAA